MCSKVLTVDVLPAFPVPHQLVFTYLDRFSDVHGAGIAGLM